MAYYSDFIQLWYILLTLGPFHSWPQNFGLFWNGSKFQNFTLCDDKIWESQYCIYLHLADSKSSLVNMEDGIASGLGSQKELFSKYL